MTKKQMMNAIIRELGFEDNITIAFCNYAETHTLKETKGAYARAKKLIEYRMSREW